MRELEFLPSWYCRLKQRRRLVMMEVWAALVLTGGAVLWTFLSQRNVSAAEGSLAALKGQLVQTHAQLEQMDRLESLRRQWRQKAQVLAKMGEHVQVGRMVSLLDEVLPAEMSLLGLTMDMEETPAQVSGVTRAAMKDPTNVQMDRRMRVRLQGVAPTDVELATFLTELNKVPFLEHVAPTYARDRKDSGHVLREFEVTFTISLNTPAGS